MKTTSSKVSRIGDTELVNDLAGKVFSASRRRLPIIVAFFYYILRFLFSVGAFIPRAVLRSKLGERTYGVITVGFVYVFFACVQVSIDAAPLAKEKLLMLLQEVNGMGGIEKVKNSSLYDLLGTYYVSRSNPKTRGIIEQMSGFLLWEVFRKPVQDYNGLTGALMIFWSFILTISAWHFIELFNRKRKGEVVHSFHRGNSIFSFFSGRRFLGLQIRDFHIWLILEPLFIFSIAIFFDFAFNLTNLSFVLKVSATCLFLEEYSVYMENRSLVLDIADSLIDGEKLTEVQESYSIRINSIDKPRQGPSTAVTSVVID